MKALKALVIGMGVMIIAGLGLVVFGLYRTNHAPSGSAPTPTAKSGYFSTELPVPAGTKLDQMTAAGDRVILHITDGDTDRILILDPQSGQITGSISLVRPSH
jgi:hypothetical protein